MDEQQLITRAVAGDPAAERLLFDVHVDRVYRLAYRMSGDAMAAQEYTQETFVRAFAHLPQFRGESALGTWLHAIALSVILNGLRQLKRRRNREVELDTIENTAYDGGESDPLLQRRLAAAIDALADAQNEALQAAVMADVDSLWPQLALLARDRERSPELRRTAIFWLGMQAQDAAAKTLGELADSDAEDLEIRKLAVFAIAERPDSESIPALMRMARTHRNPEIRKTALFWLAQEDAPEVIDLFESILLGGS